MTNASHKTGKDIMMLHGNTASPATLKNYNFRQLIGSIKEKNVMQHVSIVLDPLLMRNQVLEQK